MLKAKVKGKGNTDTPIQGKGKEKEKLKELDAGEMEELRTSLRRQNDSFSFLLGLIPPKFYLHDEEEADGEDELVDTKRPSKRQRRQLELDQKRLERETLDAKRKAKKAKFDPDTPRTVIEIQAARNQAATAAVTKKPVNGDRLPAKQMNGHAAVNGFTDAAIAESEEDSPNESHFEDDEQDEHDTAPALPRALGASTQDVFLPPQAVRLPDQSPSTGEASRDALLLERRQKRGEMREKRRKEVKERKRKEKESGVKHKKDKDEQSQMSTLPPSDLPEKQGAMSDVKKALKKAGKRSAQSLRDQSDQDAVAEAPSVALVKKKDSLYSSTIDHASTSTSVVADPSPVNIAFSSLDFTPSGTIISSDTAKLNKKARLAMNTSTRTGVTSHDPSIALNALNKRDEFLAKLTPQARERAEDKDKWERMGMRAEGTKVYDEEAKLKKMVKRKEKSKEKSRKDWADRKETTINSQASAAKRRNDNINSRLQMRKDKKMGVKPSKSLAKPNPKKKGRPGFEGRGGARGK